jgi:hypothetical protein
MGQVLGRKVGLVSSGKYKLETKEHLRKPGRNMPSPDEADAVFCAMMPNMLARSFNLGREAPVGWDEQVAEVNQRVNEGQGRVFFQ